MEAFVPPNLDDGTPFPTTYWLTCPLLVQRVSALEASGMVKVFDEIIQRKDFVDKLGNDNQVDKALNELENSQVIARPQRGYYQLVGSSSSSGTYTEGKEGKTNSISAHT